MLKNVLVLDDGSEIVAGYVGKNAIMSLSHTAMVSSTTDLVPGAACSAKIEVTIWVEPGGSLVITSGTRMRYYREDASGARTLVGTFWAVKPTRQTRNTYKVLAYDVVSKLDGIQSTWLRSIQGDFPMTIWAFAQRVAQRCNVEIANTELPRNGDYSVAAFYSDNLTGRQMLSWVAQAACTFLRATPDGKLEFAWYETLAGYGISPGTNAEGVYTALDLSGELLATSDDLIWTFRQPQTGYYDGTLSYEDYQVAPIDKVQIRQSQDDVGVIYPPDEAGANAVVIEGNPLLTAESAEALQPVAQSIYETMQPITYTPLSVSVPLAANTPPPGTIILVTDPQGRTMTTYIMQVQITGQKAEISSTGSATRDGTAAVNAARLENTAGKMLELQASIDGLTVKASELEGDYTELSQTVEGLSVSVVKDGEVRTKFALDDTSVTINTGVISFQSDSISIDSQNFQLETNGNVTATGIFRSNNGVSGAGRNESILSSGGLQLYRTLSNGQNTIAASLSSDGQNAAMGHFALYGATGVQMLTADAEYAGMSFVLRDGYGHGMITMSPTNGGSAEFEGNVDIQGSVGLGVTTTINCANLNAYGSKNRAVLTDRGYVGMGAMESPQPAFADFGCGVCDDDGLCLLQLDPRYLDTVAAAYAPRWSITATAPGHLWLEKRGQDALVHGAAGQTFDWIVIIPQRGYENQYAEPVDGSPPPTQIPSRDVADVLPGTIDPPSDIIPNTDTIAASQSLAAERRPA